MMKYFTSYLLLFVLSIPLFVTGQEKVYPMIYSDDIRKDIERPDFGDQLSVKIATDADYDYYAIDLNKLEGDFQKTYFLNLIYQEKIVISIDSDLGKENLWVKSSSIYPENEVQCLLDELMEEAKRVSEDFPESERKAWLNEHRKLIKN